MERAASKERDVDEEEEEEEEEGDEEDSRGGRGGERLVDSANNEDCGLDV